MSRMAERRFGRYRISVGTDSIDCWGYLSGRCWQFETPLFDCPSEPRNKTPGPGKVASATIPIPVAAPSSLYSAT